MATDTLPTCVLCGYERISNDPKNELAGADRQHVDILALAADYGRKNGVSVRVCWHRDNDKSAWREGVERDGFEAMLDHVGDELHPSRGILAYDLDRLVRRGDDLQRALKLYRNGRAEVFKTASGEIDLSGPGGRFVAEILTSVATMESEAKSRRQKDWHRHRAHAGQPTAGPTGFGWRTKMELDPVEAPLLRQAAYDVLYRVRTTEQVARHWNEAGVLTRPRRPKLPDGGKGEPVFSPWSSAKVTQLLKVPYVGGFVKYRGKLLEGADGGLVRSQRPAIMDSDDWLQLVDYLASDARGGGREKQREARRRYLASGLLRCKSCRSRMIGHGDSRVGRFQYVCHKAEGRGCGSTRIDGPDTDAFLNRALESALADAEPSAVDIGEYTWSRQAEYDELSGRHALVLDAYAGGSADAELAALSKTTLIALLQRLEDSLADLNTERRSNARARARARQLAEASDLTRWRESFAAQDWHTCRWMLDALILEVQVTPAPRRGRRRKGEPIFDSARLEVVPRRPPA